MNEQPRESRWSRCLPTDDLSHQHPETPRQHPEIKAEQAYITRAHALLEKARARAKRLRTMVEVGRGGTRQALFERDVIEEQVAQRLAQLELGPSSLVFGRTDHIDLAAADSAGTDSAGANSDSTDSNIPDSDSTDSARKNQSEEPPATFYIGRLAVSNEEQEPIVIDWRARIAEPFFRATSQEPLGLLRRRHFTTRGAELLDIEDEIFELDRFFAASDAANDAASDSDAIGDTAGNAPGAAANGETAGNAPGVATNGATPGAAAENPHNLRAHGALYAALEERRGGQMSDVVATIQGDQDEIVRSPLPGKLIVQGGPGTGKTVVALHRAAYLLYTNRFPLADQGLLVIGPNRLFLRYIERVLPSLGEVGAHLYVLADLFNELFPSVQVTKPSAPSEAAVKGSSKMSEVLTKAVALRQRPLKTRLRIPFRASYLTLTPQQSRLIIAEARKRFRHHNAAARFVENSVLTTLASSQPGWGTSPTDDGVGDSSASTATGSTGDDRAGSTAADNAETSDAEAGTNEANTDKAGTDETDGTADNATGSNTENTHAATSEAAARRLARVPEHLQEAAPVAVIRERFSEHSSLIEALDRMWPSLTPAQFLRDLYGSAALLSASSKGVLSEAEQDVLYRARGDNEASYEWSDADVPLLDEAYELLGPRQIPKPLQTHGQRKPLDAEIRTFGHIVIDEAQDHSPMALRMIARRSLNGSMTIVGDIAQATSPSAVADWDEIVDYLDTGQRRTGKTKPPPVNLRTLTLSYRIPEPSLEPANRVLAAYLPDVVPAVAVRTQGPEPLIIPVESPAANSAANLANNSADTLPNNLKTAVQAVQSLVDENLSVLVVAAPSQIDRLEDAMSAAEMEFGRAMATSRNATGALHQKVTLATVELIKGLETDAVAVIEPAAIVEEEPRGWQALYVALTRATRQIAVVHALPLPEPLVPSDSASYAG